MKERLDVYYDEEGNYLEVNVGKPVKDYFKNLGDDVFEIVEEKTGKIRGFAIIGFKKRMGKTDNIEVKVPAKDNTKCPQCKSQMENIRYDVGYGIEVESQHCKKCGFNITEKEQLRPAIAKLRNFIKTGN